jgi:4'-phosphopantetheinyl transferase
LNFIKQTEPILLGRKSKCRVVQLWQKQTLCRLAKLGYPEMTMTDREFNLNLGQIHVWYADIKTCRIFNPEDYLSRDDLDRARRFRFKMDFNRFVMARALLRVILSQHLPLKARDITFEYDVNGKPGLKGASTDGIQFNVSHSGDKVIMALVRGKRVGVDVEQVNASIAGLELARQNFSLREVAEIEDSPDEEKAKMFYRIWTRKEALLKAIGVGLGGLSKDLCLVNGGDVYLDETQWEVIDLYFARGYAAALAVEGAICELSIRPADLLFKCERIKPLTWKSCDSYQKS